MLCELLGSSATDLVAVITMLRSRAPSPNRRRDGERGVLKDVASEFLRRVGDAEHRLAGQLKRAREDADELGADLKRARRDATTENSRLRKDRDYWRNHADALQAEIDGLKASKMALQTGKEADVSTHKRQIRQLKSECDDLTTKHAKQGEDLAATRTRCDVLVKETTQKLQVDTEQAIVDFLRQLSGVFCENGLACISDDEGGRPEESGTTTEDGTFRLQVFTPMIEDKRDGKAVGESPDPVLQATARDNTADVESVSPATSHA